MDLLYPTAYLLFLLGLLFAVVPVLPGTLVVWLGIFAWASADGFHALSLPLVAVLGVIALVAVGADVYTTTILTRKSGGSWKAVFGALIGGLIGGGLLSAPLPFIGTIVGGIIGSVIGVMVVEFVLHREWRQALKAGGGFLVGYFVSTAVRLVICLGLIGIFALKALVLK
ncbi:MAG TPA: DUF456 domain-containing protein [Anaerolineae bacterium]|jgi:hypothetical protein